VKSIRVACPARSSPVARAAGALVVCVAPSARAQAVLGVQGPAAAGIADLWWLLLTVASLVVVIVVALYVFAVTAAGNGRSEAPPWSTTFIVVGGMVIPALILVAVLIYSLGATAALAGPSEPAVTIEVVGHQWWWEVRYPEHGIVTANEIQVPVGQPVRLELSSVDVIHSFWVPSLNGKMDLVPGQTNTLWIEAGASGIFQGSCAEYCGVQHAKMGLLVSALPPDAFRSWLADQQADASPPDTVERERGLRVFLESPCAHCHTIRGTAATGQVGPDLTHLASRLTLGAGSLANGRGNLGGWIVDSQAVKPGNLMPPMQLDSPRLQSLLTYLEGLE
jgi:cytochrome c oxidase subunit 2